jgi:capsular polysaccharide export protein
MYGILRLPPWLERARPLSEVIREDCAQEDRLDDQDLLERAAHGIRLIVAEGLGGTWWRKPWANDRSSAYQTLVKIAGNEPTRLLQAMIAYAEQHCGIDRVLVQLPDTVESRLTDCISDLARRGATILPADTDVWSLFPAIATVHSLDEEIGFLALLAGKEVVCHGPAFYAGWGVTTDVADVPARPEPRSVTQLFADRVLQASRYREPYGDRECSFEEALDVVRTCRRFEIENRQISVCVGMAFWKRKRIGNFLRGAVGRPQFVDQAKRAVAIAQSSGTGIAVWASRAPADLTRRAAEAGIPLTWVEDGFVRSAGLGADFIPPASISLDRRTPYYDPAQPSDLERILETIELDAAATARTRRLIDALVARKITKYAGSDSEHHGFPAGHTILVPGQVEDDRSVLLGSAGVRGNLDLLQRVRAGNPDAHIVYKPHPDVEAGHRKGAVADQTILRYADRIVRRGSMAELIMATDELHSLTSLAGFEALLRGRRVTVYGQPFYAGWGLTTDMAPPPRRGRRLTLEQLVAGTLIHYPRYVDPVTEIPCGPEILIARFADEALWRPTSLVRLRRLQGRLSRSFSRVRRRAAQKI